jgi:hypothetical protein
MALTRRARLAAVERGEKGGAGRAELLGRMS